MFTTQVNLFCHCHKDIRSPIAKYHMLRDRRVFDWVWQRRIPLAFSMAGGYGNNIDETVQVQMNTYRVALAYAAKWQSWQNKA